MPNPNPTPEAPACEEELANFLSRWTKMIEGLRPLMCSQGGLAFNQDHIDHWRQRAEALEAQLAERTRERDCRVHRETFDQAVIERDAYQARASAAEARVRELEAGLSEVREELELISSVITSREDYSAEDDEDLEPIERMIMRLDRALLNKTGGSRE